MKFVGVTAICLVLLSSTAWRALADTSEGRIIFGEGMTSCGTWTQAYQARSAAIGRAAQ
jgi:hypothetical protein